MVIYCKSVLSMVYGVKRDTKIWEQSILGWVQA
jgi:hypothetical protein